MALSTPNVRARPTPRIQLKYHIGAILQNQ
jgi:hypothetical protein